MAKIYFCGSIRGGRQLAATYETIIAILQVHGRVLTEHLGDDSEIETRDRALSDRAIHDRDLQWIRESDVVVAEVTVPSLGVGYEIGRAIEMGKPVLCLFNNGTKSILSAMIAGSPDVVMVDYSDPVGLRDLLKEFISQSVVRRTS